MSWLIIDIHEKQLPRNSEGAKNNVFIKLKNISERKAPANPIVIRGRFFIQSRNDVNLTCGQYVLKRSQTSLRRLHKNRHITWFMLVAQHLHMRFWQVIPLEHF